MWMAGWDERIENPGIVTGTVQRGALRCWDLVQTGMLDSGECCERCHSAEIYAPAETLGPCRVVLADGREAFVCCAARRLLLA